MKVGNSVYYKPGDVGYDLTHTGIVLEERSIGSSPKKEYLVDFKDGTSPDWYDAVELMPTT